MRWQPRRVGAMAVALAMFMSACSGGNDSPKADTGSEESEIEGDKKSEAASGEFSMLSYNVAGLPQEFSTEQPKEDIPQISPLLNDYDIVLTQEDFDFWVEGLASFDFVNYHDRLRAEATHEYKSGKHPGIEAVGIDGSDPARPLPFVGDGLGFMSRYPFTDVERVPWTHCYGDFTTGASDCLAMKGFMVGTFELAPGIEVDIYTFHGEAGEGPEDQPIQVENWEQLAAFMLDHSDGRAVIIAGDTNLHLEEGHDQQAGDTPIWNGFLEATGLTDVCGEVTCTEPGSIDKVAYRDNDAVTFEPIEERWESERFVDAAGDDLSDHPPVAVDWRWTVAD